MVENIKKIQKLLKKYNLKTWVLINKGNSDNIFAKYISKNIYTLSMCFISLNKVYILIHDLDKDNLNKGYLEKNNINVIWYNGLKDMNNKIEDIISYLDFTSNISLSYSTIGDKDIDILGHGEYVEFTDILKRPYIRYRKKITFSSAEKVIYSLLSEKSKKQIERITKAQIITNEILDTTFKTIKVGANEIEIKNRILTLTKKIGSKYLNNEIISISLAWENCPFVLTGENLIKGGHTLPSSRTLKKGDTIYFDFGICLNYFDNEKIYSDIQRMGYVLKDKQVKAPKNIQRIFDTLYNSIHNALDYMKPDTEAYKIDEIVREYILKENYPGYNHATGHPVGLAVHDIGAIISTQNNKRSNLTLTENCIYTLEPRIPIENGGSIEEMFLVTKFGAIAIGNTQEKLYLIKG